MTVTAFRRARAVLDGVKALPAEDDDADEPILTDAPPPDVEVEDDTADPDQAPLIEDVEVTLPTEGALDLFTEGDVSPVDADAEDDAAAEDKDEVDAAGAKGVQVGSFVQWRPDAATAPVRGRVDLVVTKGAVPGFTGASCTVGVPAARVVLYHRSGGQWVPTGTKVAVPAADLTVSHTLLPRPVLDDPAAALVGMVTDHEAAGLAPVPGDAVRVVYDRGVKAWPGAHVTVLTAQQWGLARAAAFLDVAAGKPRPGYVGDRDLLPGAPG